MYKLRINHMLKQFDIFGFLLGSEKKTKDLLLKETIQHVREMAKKTKCSVLFEAVYLQHQEIILYLLQDNPPLYKKDCGGNNILHVLAINFKKMMENGNKQRADSIVSAMKEIIIHEKKLNQRLPENSLLNINNDFGITPKGLLKEYKYNELIIELESILSNGTENNLSTNFSKNTQNISGSLTRRHPSKSSQNENHSKNQKKILIQKNNSQSTPSNNFFGQTLLNSLFGQTEWKKDNDSAFEEKQPLLTPKDYIVSNN